MEKIIFKNGSYIKIIPSKEYKHGYIRGKRLTDEESRQIIFRENINAEQIVNNVIKELGL